MKKRKCLFVLLLFCFSFFNLKITLLAGDESTTTSNVDWGDFDTRVAVDGVVVDNGVRIRIEAGDVTKNPITPGTKRPGGTTNKDGTLSVATPRIERNIVPELVGGGTSSVFEPGLWDGSHGARFYITDGNGNVLSNSVDFSNSSFVGKNFIVGSNNPKGGYGTKLGSEYYNKLVLNYQQVDNYIPKNISGLPNILTYKGTISNPLVNFITGMNYSSLISFLSNFNLNGTTADKMMETFMASGNTNGVWYYLVAEPIIYTSIRTSDGVVKNYALTATEVAMMFDQNNLSNIPNQTDLLLKQLQNSLFVSVNSFNNRIKGVTPATSPLTKTQALSGNGYGMNYWGLHQIAKKDTPPEKCDNLSEVPSKCSGSWKITSDQFATYQHADFGCVYGRSTSISQPKSKSGLCTVHCTEDMEFNFPKEMPGVVPAGSNFWPNSQISISGTRVCRTNEMDLNSWWKKYIDASDQMRLNWAWSNIARDYKNECKSKENQTVETKLDEVETDEVWKCKNGTQSPSLSGCGPKGGTRISFKYCVVKEISVSYLSPSFSDLSMESNIDLSNIALGVAKIHYNYSYGTSAACPSMGAFNAPTEAEAKEKARSALAVRLRQLCNIEFDQEKFLGDYNAAKSTRDGLETEIRSCNNFPMNYQFAPNVFLTDFHYYGELIPDIKLNRNIYISSPVREAYATVQDLKNKSYRALDNVPKSYSVCTDSTTCTSIKKNFPWNQIVEKRMRAAATNFTLPEYTFQYILKPEGRMVSQQPTSGNYRLLDRPGLPTKATDLTGYTYEYNFRLSNLGNADYFDPYLLERGGNSYSCTYSVDCTTITCDSPPPPCGSNCEAIKRCNPLIENCDQTEGYAIKFRTISLEKPFPAVNGNGRIPGSNWIDSGYRGSYNYATWEQDYSQVVNYYIVNNRGVKGNKVYEKDPMYSLTLTPELIKQLREYNNSHKYDDFNLTCEKGTGLACKSNFIRNDFRSAFDNTCGLNNDFYYCDGVNGDNHSRNLVRGDAY